MPTLQYKCTNYKCRTSHLIHDSPIEIHIVQMHENLVVMATIVNENPNYMPTLYFE